MGRSCSVRREAQCLARAFGADPSPSFLDDELTKQVWGHVDEVITSNIVVQVHGLQMNDGCTGGWGKVHVL